MHNSAMDSIMRNLNRFNIADALLSHRKTRNIITLLNNVVIATLATLT
jgi:hypothetical protein